MIYGSTGVTHFDQLAEILTGYEMTLFGARSGGIFAGILFIAVGSLFKITAVPFRAAVGRPPMGGRQIAANRQNQLPSPRGHLCMGSTTGTRPEVPSPDEGQSVRRSADG
ncbi:hypothetical protein SUGI_1226080 [Cryptomeria japonica]|uniref:NADH dehydrogenase subunit 2 n=1 Tax=Cryptomeria japonica TaxID=3369 RepID=A0AAD3NMV0_CRYJA|nr:hypothetical protein SUGI_1226080 [Cryptomeria japonica]